MARTVQTITLIFICIALWNGGAQAQIAAPVDLEANSHGQLLGDHVDTLEDVIVTARRAGTPMWTVTRGDSTIILVGAINGVPGDFAWRPEALEAATGRSQRILYPQEGRASLSDLVRLIWRIRTVGRLPAGKTTADYLSPAMQVRLDALMAGRRDQAWRTQSLVVLSLDLIEQAGFERRGRAPVEAVRQAARRARVEGEPVGIFRGDTLVDNLISEPPATYVGCVEASIAAAEAGPAGAAARLDDWRSLRVAQVLASPLDRALNLCWPSGDPDIAPVLRRQWVEATQTALTRSGITLGVASLRVLAEPGGVLDRLQADGVDVVGPAWKSIDAQ